MDKITFDLECPSCSGHLKCKPTHVGRKTKCPKCNVDLRITKPRAVLFQRDAPVPPKESAWSITESLKSIDDSIVRVASLAASDETEIPANLIFRSNLRLCSVSCDLYISFDNKVFSIRDDLPPCTIRFDQTPPKRAALSVSERGNACFFTNSTELIASLQSAMRMLVEVSLMKFGTRTFKFETYGFDLICQQLLSGAVSAKWSELQVYNQDIVDYLIRIGPRNLENVISVLTSKNFLPAEYTASARVKSIQLFAAAQSFGEKHGVSEILGHISNGRANDPFSIAIYNCLSPKLKTQAGKLYISD